MTVKVDSTAGAIVKALRGVGVRVLVLNATVDAILCFQNRLYLVDFKSSSTAPKTRRQKMLVEDGWPVHFLWTVEDALKLVGVQ